MNERQPPGAGTGHGFRVGLSESWGTTPGLTMSLGLLVAIVVVAVLAVGCADGSPTVGDSSEASSTSVSSTTTVETTARSTTTTTTSDREEQGRFNEEQQARVERRRQEAEDLQNVEPITGYGDFSNTEYVDVDWYEVTRLQIQCMRDQGFEVEPIPPGDGIDFSNVPPTQHQEAQKTSWACLTGLNLPEPTEPADDQLAEHYDYLLEAKECLEAEGYETGDPPSLDTYIETGGQWSPYNLVAQDDTIGIEEWNALNVACPQIPRRQ